MSKCREAFEKQYGEDFNPDHSPVASVWQAAWDARGKVDVEICKEQSIRSAEAMNQMATYGAVKCEIAIKQEQCMK